MIAHWWHPSLQLRKGGCLKELPQGWNEFLHRSWMWTTFQDCLGVSTTSGHWVNETVKNFFSRNVEILSGILISFRPSSLFSPPLLLEWRQSQNHPRKGEHSTLKCTYWYVHKQSSQYHYLEVQGGGTVFSSFLSFVWWPQSGTSSTGRASSG